MDDREALRAMRHLRAEVECPFCGEGDFDLNGLKGHLQNGCEAFDRTPSIHEMSDSELLAGAAASREARDSAQPQGGRRGTGR